MDCRGGGMAEQLGDEYCPALSPHDEKKDILVDNY